jgi:signal transduction histidine kinase
MVNDVTERKRMEAEVERSRRNLEFMVGQRTKDLLRANAELQQASTARDMVFVNLAQELRTSLQTITGFSDLLAGGKTGTLSDEQRRQVEMIQQAGKRLATFANTLMESRRTSQRDLVTDVEDFDLVALVESVLFGLATFAEDKGLTLRLVADERPINVKTDRYKLQQILLNLFSNAIRYTDRGAVGVTVTRGRADTVCVAVEDTGPGLMPEQLERIFHGPEVHDSAAGIGLPTSRRLATMLGGTIDVESTPGQGSIFTLRVPERCLELVPVQEEPVE